MIDDDIFGTGEQQAEPVAAEPVAAEPVAAEPKPARRGRAPRAATPEVVQPDAKTPAPIVLGGTRAETLDALRKQFAGMCIVNYNPDSDVFMFEGGAQGRVTTTANQPHQAIANVGREYCNINQGARLMSSALGNVG